MSKYEEYRARVAADRDISNAMVAAGTITPEEGMFRDMFRKDEILEEMDWEEEC